MSAAPAVPTSAPLSALKPNPANPRTVFDDAKQKELEASVEAHGVLEPLLVRRDGKGFEIIAGGRRYAAAQAVKLKEVPVRVIEKDDKEAFIVAVFENLSRADLSPLDEGAAYRKLLDECGYSLKQLIEETGLSRTVIFGRMKVARLDGEARELVAAGNLSTSIGEDIARYPTPELRKQAFEGLREFAINAGFGTKDDLRNLDVRRAREYLDSQLELRLKAAPFDPEDPTLVSDIANCPGVCSECPKRTGFEPDNFPDTKDDTCLDSECWALKKAAAFKRRKLEVEKEGKKLLKDGSKIFARYATPGTLSHVGSARYAKPDDKPEGSAKSWTELLGENLPVHVALDADSKEHQLVDKDEAASLLKTLAPKELEKMEEKKTKVPTHQKRQEGAERAMLIDARLTTLARFRSAKKLDPAVLIDVMLLGLSPGSYVWDQALKRAGLKGNEKLSALKPEQKVGVLLGWGTQTALSADGRVILERLAKVAKLDLKKLRKRAAAAVAGTCWVCGCTEEKACKGGCSWVNGEKTLCSSCAGGKGGK